MKIATKTYFYPHFGGFFENLVKLHVFENFWLTFTKFGTIFKCSLQ